MWKQQQQNSPCWTSEQTNKQTTTTTTNKQTNKKQPEHGHREATASRQTGALKRAASLGPHARLTCVGIRNVSPVSTEQQLLIPHNFEPEFTQEELAVLERATIVKLRRRWTECHGTCVTAVSSLTISLLSLGGWLDTNLDDYECITEHPSFNTIVVIIISQ